MSSIGCSYKIRFGGRQVENRLSNTLRQSICRGSISILLTKLILLGNRKYQAPEQPSTILIGCFDQSEPADIAPLVEQSSPPLPSSHIKLSVLFTLS